MSDLDLKEKCDHGVSLYNPEGCPDCDMGKISPVTDWADVENAINRGEYTDLPPLGDSPRIGMSGYLNVEHMQLHENILDQLPAAEIAAAQAVVGKYLPQFVDAFGAKPSNPKDAMGIKKVPFTTISWPVLAELGVAMLEGALKYGRHNYRVIGVRASVYIDAANRHMSSFWEGEDIDPDTCDIDPVTGEPDLSTGLSHVTKAIASLVVLRDAMINDNWVDDRPPRPKAGWMSRLNAKVASLLKKYPNPVLPYTHMDNTWIETTPTTQATVQETAI